MHTETTMKKILIFASHFYPHTGGVERYIEEVYARLVKTGEYEVHILTISDEGERHEEYRGLHIHRIKKQFSIGSIFLVPNFGLWNKKVESLLQKHTFSVINTHTRFFLTSYLGARVAKKHHIFHLHTEHGASSVVHSSIVIRLGSRVFDGTLGSFVMKKADAVIAISRKGIDFCKSMGAKDVTYIPNGINASLWKPVLVEKNERKEILYVGRITEAKGIVFLLDAVKGLNFPFRLTMIGDGDFMAEAQIRADETKVRFLGFQNQEQILDQLNSSDCFVNPSLNEGLPTTVLEALSSGVPTVATDVGGTRDILALVPEFSELVPGSNVDRLAEALTKICSLQITSIEQMQCHDAIAGEFDWTAIVKKIDQYLKDHE